jgi:hypothetical protein
MGEWRYDSTILELDTKWMQVVSSTPLAEELPMPIVQEAGWALEPVWTLSNRDKLLSCNGNRTPGIQHLVLRITYKTVPYLSQRTELFMATAMITSNPAFIPSVLS